MVHKEVQTNYAVAPGEYVTEWLEDNHLSRAELAARMDIPEEHLADLIAGDNLTDLLALKLETGTGIRARIWLRYEAAYRADLARLEATAEE